MCMCQSAIQWVVFVKNFDLLRNDRVILNDSTDHIPSFSKAQGLPSGNSGDS